MPLRCAWVPANDPASVAYHDTEWGVPSHDEQHLFEMLTLEGAQAGLSWTTILRKREGYRTAFADFDIARVARFTDDDVERLLDDPGIVRNRLKIESTISNARAAVSLYYHGGSLDALLWSFVDGPIDGKRAALRDIPAETEASKAMSKELKRQGFRFVGPTICYALMQAVGLVNDHEMTCFRYEEIKRA